MQVRIAEYYFSGSRVFQHPSNFEEEELCAMLNLDEPLPCIIAPTFCDVSRSHWQTRQVMRYTTVLHVCWRKRSLPKAVQVSGKDAGFSHMGQILPP